ncbi:MAG: hypothetical protein ACR2MT_13485 [Aurantibacter sp.]
MKRIFLVVLFCANFVGAQKIVKKTVINSNITSVQIDAKNCFEIRMNTAKTKEMLVEAAIDGEYKSDLVLNLKENGPSILVSSGFTPNFKNPNDKLSAHKVVSIALKITLPRFKNVQVNGTSSNIIVEGAYEHLKITLNDGSCTLNEVSEAVDVLTQSGDISLYSTSAEIVATSKFGTVQRNNIPLGENRFNLTTITGNINLSNNE